MFWPPKTIQLGGDLPSWRIKMQPKLWDRRRCTYLRDAALLPAFTATSFLLSLVSTAITKTTSIYRLDQLCHHQYYPLKHRNLVFLPIVTDNIATIQFLANARKHLHHRQQTINNSVIKLAPNMTTTQPKSAFLSALIMLLPTSSSTSAARLYEKDPGFPMSSPTKRTWI